MYSELLLIGSAFPLIPGLLLTAGCLKNLPAEKEVIASWILAGRSLGKAQGMVFKLHTCSHLIYEPY